MTRNPVAADLVRIAQSLSKSILPPETMHTILPQPALSEMEQATGLLSSKSKKFKKRWDE